MDQPTKNFRTCVLASKLVTPAELDQAIASFWSKPGGAWSCASGDLRSGTGRQAGGDGPAHSLPGNAIAGGAHQAASLAVPHSGIDRPRRHGGSVQGGTRNHGPHRGDQGAAAQQIHARIDRQLHARNSHAGQAAPRKPGASLRRRPRRKRLLPGHGIRAGNRFAKIRPRSRHAQHVRSGDDHLAGGQGSGPRP